MSPTSSSPKRWRTEGHMRYKREAEVPGLWTLELQGIRQLRAVGSL